MLASKQIDSLHAAAVQVVILHEPAVLIGALARLVKTQPVKWPKGPLRDASTSLGARRPLSLDKFQLAQSLSQIMFVFFSCICLFSHVITVFVCLSFSALQDSLNQNFLLVISHREAQRDYNLNFPGSKTIQEVRHRNIVRAPSMALLTDI